MNLLVTFGCSWTYGTGCFYHRPLTLDEYRKQKKESPDEIANIFSFRALLARRHGYHNINFASQGSSNQTQLRRAQEFFNTDEYKRYDKVIVLWGITSTARGEAWMKGKPYEKYTDEEKRKMKGKFRSFMYSQKFELSKVMRNSYYDHSAEVERLETHMNHWNTFFNLLGIQNYWFDTFNHHEYDVPSMIFREDKQRDLMSKLCTFTGETYNNDGYHFSLYTNDCNRSNYLKKNSILNPHSLHPTVGGHKMIADMLDKEISW
tara:strand:+ start:275 stop:1060 length:786 start_codon:yes stop_codon:yes gene_type:complete